MQKISSRNVAEACKKANQYRADLEHVQGSDVAMIELLEAARRELAEAKSALHNMIVLAEPYFTDVVQAAALDEARRAMAPSITEKTQSASSKNPNNSSL